MFDKEKFSNVLSDIVSHYENITDFANSTDMGRSYISKYIHQKLPSPPTPKILRKIADGAMGIVTYDELMQICGYVVSAYSQFDIQKQIYMKNIDLINQLNLTECDKEQLEYILLESNYSNDNVISKLNDFSKNYPNERGIQIYNVGFSIYTQILEALSQCKIPVYNRISFDKNKNYYFSSADISEYISLPTDLIVSNNVADYYGFKASDDSMLPVLGTGDNAIIHSQNTFEYGQTFLIIFNNQILIRKIIKVNDTIELQALNPYFPSIVVAKNEFTTIGKVVRADLKSYFK